MDSIARLIASQPFFAELSQDDLVFIAGCARNERYDEGGYLAEEGEAADWFFFIRSGRVAIETCVPAHMPVILETLREGDVAGWSWLVPPHRWSFDVRALEPTLALAFDGHCLLEKCEQNPALGYELMKRFATVMTRRLRATRLRLLDLFASEEASQ